MNNKVNSDKPWRLVCLLCSYGISESDRKLVAARELLRSVAALKELECVYDEQIQISSKLPEFEALNGLYTRTDVVHLRPLSNSKESEKSIRYLLRLAFRNCVFPESLWFGVLTPELIDSFPINGKVLLP